MKTVLLVVVLVLVVAEVRSQGTFETFKKKHTHNLAQGALKCTDHMKKNVNTNVRKPCRPFNSVIFIAKRSVLEDLIKICQGEGDNVNPANTENKHKDNYYRSHKTFTVIDCTLTSPASPPRDQCEYESGDTLENRILTVACEAKSATDEAAGKHCKPVHFHQHD